MKTNLLYFSIFLLISLCVLSILISSRTIQKIHRENIKIKLDYEQQVRKLEMVNKRQDLVYNSESRVLSNISLLNWEKDSIPIKKLINKPKLIYRFYKSTCYQCYEDELDILKKVSEVIGDNRILIITDMSLVDTKVILSRKGINAPFFKFEKRFDLPFDQEKLNPNNVGTFFVLDSNLRTDLVYIAGGKQDISFSYFQRIKQYFIGIR